jgi:hypothetical protein
LIKGILHDEDFKAINPLRDCFDKGPFDMEFSAFFCDFGKIE